MVDKKGSVAASPLPSGLNDATASLIESADRVDGSVILFDAQDNIVWVNERQRALMPCTDYVGQTYSTLFWSALDKGLVGNPVAVKRPNEWLEFAVLERASNKLMQSINRYAWGDMALTHRRFDDGSSLQIRFPTDGIDAASPERLLMAAVEARREVAALRHALDGLEIGIGIIDYCGLQIYANAALQSLMAQDLGLMLGVGGKVEPMHPGDYSHWSAGITMAAAGSSAVMLVPGSDAPPMLALSMFPGANPGTILLLAAPLRPSLSHTIADGLSEAFGITEDEAEIVAKLATGRNLQQIASDHRGEENGNVTSPFLHVAGVRQALRRHNLTADNHAQIAAMVLQIAAITRAPMARTF